MEKLGRRFKTKINGALANFKEFFGASRIFEKLSGKLASFKEEQRPDCSNAASHVDAAVLAHVARSGRSDAALR